ncbi:MAG: Type II secretion system protein F [candidate division WS2 bacterium ADurb.Bin280]|uniref:Type II secretion system protein F n=1 Tax=candidate division WS2 bacterium ADurb.Bin280 TaxID=1852829 RepID=A0A1V5SDM0_9BACT|nr:MAG: Type II secretion system protein F [candidate division WS2 bacterium ADurb.Bin280]
MDINLRALGIGGISIKEKSLFTRALATMISSGLPIIKSFEILAKQTDNEQFRAVINNIIARLEEGEALSSALSKHKDIFDNVYVSTIKAGESTGKLEQILNQLAIQQEKDYKLSSSIKAAVAYPFFVVIMMVIAGILLLAIVVPKISLVFEQNNTTLPWTTRSLIATGNFLASYWYAIIIIAILAIVWLRYYLKSDAGKNFFSRLVLSLPLLKGFYVGVYMTRFTRTLSMLVASGVPIMTSVSLVADVIDNNVYEKVLRGVALELERGVPISSPLSRTATFPPMVSQMIVVGEQTGKLDEILMVLSGFYEEETEKRVKSLSALLEPILLIIVGLGVGIIVFSIIVPLYQITGYVG